jgi:export-related chaperone CsaA
MATIAQFSEMDIRVGRIIEVEDHPTARKPMYKLSVDFGAEVGRRTIIAGIKDYYNGEELIGKKVIAIVNLEPKSIAGIISEAMLLAAEDESAVSLLTTDKEIKEGGKIR